MPSLTPIELQEARLRSGNLGGRPKAVTRVEARQQALDRLVPRALKVLENHLDEGGAQAARAALQILNHAWGRPAEHVTFETPLDDAADLRTLSDAALDALRVRLLGQ